MGSASTGMAGIHPSKPAPCSSARTTAYNAIRNHVPAAGTRSNPGENQGLTADGRASITIERCGFCNTTIALETGPDGTSEWTLDDSDYGPEGSSDNQKGNR